MLTSATAMSMTELIRPTVSLVASVKLNSS